MKRKGSRTGLISVDATIDDIAAKALNAARQEEEKAKRKKETEGGKVAYPPTWPRTAPTPKEKPRK